MASTRFAHLGTPNPNSRFRNLSEALRVGLTENDDARFSGYAEQQEQSGSRTAYTAAIEVLAKAGPLKTEGLSADARDLADATRAHVAAVFNRAKAQEAEQKSIASTPKPIPVPGGIETKGTDCASAYRKAFRAETSRLLNLVAQPAAAGRHLAAVELAEAGLNDAEIIARLPNEPTDEAKRAMKQQAETSALWDRAIARNNGLPVPSPAASTTAPAPKSANAWDAVWNRAIAANNPGYKPA